MDFLSDFFNWRHGDIYNVLGELRYAFGSEFPLFQVIAGAHPHTPREVLQELLSQGHPEVLWGIGGNPQAGDDVLAELLTRWPRAVIEQDIQGLADPWTCDVDGIPKIRYGTDNPWELEDVPVVASVAGNQSIGSDVITWLTEVDSQDVAKALILRNGQRLTSDHWRRLFEGAKSRISGSKETFGRYDGWLQWIADSPHTPLFLVQELLRDEWEGPLVARRQAMTPHTAVETLRLLLDTGVDEGTRSLIAQHSATAPDMLATLAVDPSSKVRQGVITNPNTDEATKALAALGG
jgi:hypothetical protein